MIHFLKKRLIYTPDDRLFTNDWQTAYAVVYQVFRLFFFKSSCLKLSLYILPYIRVLHKGLAQDSPTTKNFKRNNCVVLNRFRFIVAVPSCELWWKSSRPEVVWPLWPKSLSRISIWLISHPRDLARSALGVLSLCAFTIILHLVASRLRLFDSGPQGVEEVFSHKVRKKARWPNYWKGNRRLKSRMDFRLVQWPIWWNWMGNLWIIHLFWLVLMTKVMFLESRMRWKSHVWFWRRAGGVTLLLSLINTIILLFLTPIEIEGDRLLPSRSGAIAAQVLSNSHFDQESV